MQGTEREGRCLCGAVQFKVTLKTDQAHVCHCHMCRSWGYGGPGISVDCEKNAAIAGAESLGWYDSSEHAQRGFCRQCGSSLFYRLKYEDYMNVSTACLASESDLRLKDHIFIDKKPPYYDFADQCPRLTEQEFLAQFEEPKQ